MWVEHLSLSHFRNYDRAEIALKPGANLFLGSNGQGKTNIVEAISYFSALSSHRVASDQALIQQDAASAIARLWVHTQNRQILLELQINRDGPKRAQLNKNTVKPRDLLGHFSSVMFAPEDVQIIRGDPSGRRLFIDNLVVSLKPSSAQLFADYERVVKQRSSLLKSSKLIRTAEANSQSAPADTLEIWNERLITLGARVITERLRVLDLLQQPFSDAYAYLVEADHLPRLTMRSTVFVGDGSVSRETSEIERSFAESLRGVSQEERDRGLTLVGPHRDDIDFQLNALPVKGFASHGETWSFALALRLASAELLRELNPGGSPVVILDDVFAELDQHRRERLFNAVRSFDQVLVTAAVAEDVPPNVDWHIIRIRAGEVIA